MKHIITILVILQLCMTTVHAQELRVKSFSLSQSDLSAQTNPRKDNNDVNCALVKVGFGQQGCLFEGGIKGSVENKTGEYWVYMPKGNRFLKVKHPNFSPLMVTFADYGIEKLESNRTYILTVVPEGVAPQNVDVGGNFYVMTVMPKNAKVTIDGALQPADADGQYSAMLPYGQHSYNVEAGGYISKNGSFTVTSGEMSPITVSLVSAMATVSITCSTPAVSLYVDKKQVAQGSWKGNLKEGMHLIEARKDGYRSQQKTIQLSQQQKLDVNLDALTAIQGSLSVNYKPFGADVYIDGKKVGQSPRVFNEIQVGNHKVEIKNEGYISATQNITITDGQTASFSGSLTQSSSGNASSSSSNDGTLSFTVKGVTFEMVPVQGGTFTMGATYEQSSYADSDEKPTHNVTLNDYYLGKYEVTQALWQTVMDDNPSYWKAYNQPVEMVSWKDCQKFVSKLNKMTGECFRLPTEAEWEYACRGGNKRRGYKFSGSNKLDDVAWYKGNSGCTHSVGTKYPNELGIYDMSGNVWEWCQDRYGKYEGNALVNPTGASGGSDRVNRGGSWDSSDKNCRSSLRDGCAPDFRDYGLGLRLALSK